MVPVERIDQRLSAARQRTFVGRRAERALFESVLHGSTTARIVYLHGAAGSGKTALIREFARIASERGASPLAIDARDLEPAPDRLLAALARAAGTANEDLWGWLETRVRPVVLIDTCEQIAVLDEWLRETFIPRLPATSVLVLAGRNPPAPGWRSDAGLSELYRALPLRNLTPAEAREYTERRGVPEAHRQTLLAATYGHPLALALFADLLAQREIERIAPLERHASVVQVLVQRFVDAVPSARHRLALEAAALARVTTEAMLIDVLDGEDAHEPFTWLRGLSFIEQGSDGLFPHDLARDVLQADLRWRNPDRYRELHRRIRSSVLRRLTATRATDPRLIYDNLFLHKRGPLMRPYFDFLAIDGVHVAPASPGDRGDILDILRRHEGDASARIAAQWLERQPGAFQVWRRAGAPPGGMMAHLRFDALRAEDAAIDPALARIQAHVAAAGGLRRGECLLVHRFWAGRDGYQDTASQTMIAAAASLLWVTTPGLAWSFPCTADPDRWAPMFAYCDFSREPSLDFVVGGRRSGVFAHDWRREPVTVWIDRLAEREVNGEPSAGEPLARGPEPLVLSRPDFDAAVRQALRDYARPAALAGNPLVRCRLIAAAPDRRPAESLRALLTAAVQSLRGNPRDEKLYRALCHTYLQPAESQELAAERLGLPFSTYRYHLKGGIERVADWLWDRDIEGGPWQGPRAGVELEGSDPR